MRKFALLLVSVIFVISCGNGKSGLLFGVRELDFVDKAETTVQGTVVDAEWPLGMIRDIIVCDSFLVVNTDERGAQVYVYTDDYDFLGRFGFIGRAKNEFVSSAHIVNEQTFKDADGNTLIPLIDENNGVKVMNLQESVKNQNTTIVTENRYMDYRPVFKDGNAFPLQYDFVFLDDDINHAFEDYSLCDFNGTVYAYPHYAVMHDSVKVKEIRLFDKSDRNYSDNLFGHIYKHPRRNLIIKPLMDMDYILFFDLDNDTTFAIHQAGSRSFKEGIPPLVMKEAGVGEEIAPEMVPHFGDVAFAESFFMVLYYATDFDVSKPDDGGKDSCELMFFDWDGNFLKSVELDHLVSDISYDEKKQILYAFIYSNESILRYDLSEVNF
jgi:hypothetical protein